MNLDHLHGTCREQVTKLKNGPIYHEHQDTQSLMFPGVLREAPPLNCLPCVERVATTGWYSVLKVRPGNDAATSLVYASSSELA